MSCAGCDAGSRSGRATHLVLLAIGRHGVTSVCVTQRMAFLLCISEKSIGAHCLLPSNCCENRNLRPFSSRFPSQPFLLPIFQNFSSSCCNLTHPYPCVHGSQSPVSLWHAVTVVDSVDKCLTRRSGAPGELRMGACGAYSLFGARE